MVQGPQAEASPSPSRTSFVPMQPASEGPAGLRVATLPVTGHPAQADSRGGVPLSAARLNGTLPGATASGSMGAGTVTELSTMAGAGVPGGHPLNRGQTAAYPAPGPGAPIISEE